MMRLEVAEKTGTQSSFTARAENGNTDSQMPYFMRI